MRLRSKYSFFSLMALMGLVVLMSYVIGAKKNQKKLGGELPVKPTKKVIMDDTEWKEKLTPEQYRILRKAGTERPYGEVYSAFKKQGSGKYACAGCDTELFSSNEKFDSKCGWPSFYDPSQAKNVKTSVDYILGYPRTEVVCAVCEGHLGHVFTGEGFDTPTDKRYCINGTVLKFVPDQPPGSEKKSHKPAAPSN